MRRKGMDHIIQNWQERISKQLSALAFCAICVYIASTSFGFLDWIPGIVGSAALYGFLGLAMLAVLAKGSIRMGQHAWWYLLFLGAGAFSCVYTTNQANTLSSLKECLVLLVICVFVFNLVTNQKRVRIVMMVMSLVPVALYFYLAATGQLDTDGSRLGQTMAANANVFASVYMIGAICSVYFIFFYEKKWLRVCFVLAFMAQIHTLALSGGRKYFLLPVILLCAILLVRQNKKGRKQLVKNALIAIGLIAVVLWAIFKVEALYQTIGHRFKEFFELLTGEGASDYSFIARQKFIELALKYWLDAPVLGNGMDSFRTLSGLNVHCHNNYLEILCDLGLIGVLIYYAFPVILLVRMCRAKHLGLQRWFWAVMILCLLGFDYGAISYNKVLIHMMFVFATMVLEQSQKLQGKDAKTP